MAKKNTEVVKVEGAEEVAVVNNVFKTEPGTNFLSETLNQNFKQVRKAAVDYKTEDIERRLKREIQDDIVELRRKSRQPQDDLIKIVPSTPLATMNLADLDEKEFVNGMSAWILDCHKAAQKILARIALYQNMFGKTWEDEEEKAFVKSMIIDFQNI